MEFYEAVRTRRMVRNYLATPVDVDVLTRIAGVARRAPSAGFTQGQSVVVVTEESTRLEIARLAGEEEYVAMGFDPWVSRAPAHIIICASEDAYHRRYREPDKLGSDGEIDWPVPFWWVDAGASLMLVLLAAVEEGLAAGFLGVHAVAGLRELLGLPEEQHPLGVVTVGHPAPDRASSSLARGWRPESDAVRWEQWDDE